MLRLLNKYRNLPKQAKASLWFVVCNILVKGISFFTLPIFSRLLTTEEYGMVSVYTSWVSVISIIASLTIWGGVFNVGMIKYSDRKYEMISSFQGLASTITIGLAILSMVLLPLLKSILGISSFLTFCIFIEIFVQTPFFLWSTEQRYRYEYKPIVIITMCMSILNPLIGVISVLNTQYKVEAKILSSIVVQSMVGGYLFIYNQRKGKCYYSSEFWKFGFMFNIVLLPHYLSMQVLNQSDRIMINNLCGSSDAGIYSIAYNFAMLLSLVTNGINSSLTPHIYQCMKDGNAKNLKQQTTGIIIAVAVLSVGLISIIPDFFHVLLPESYYPAIKVIPPVTAGAFFLFLYPLFGSVEFYFEENRYVSIASAIGAVLNIGLNNIFIRLFGFTAAAYTTLFCYVTFSICHFYFMKKIMNLRGMNIEIYDSKAIVIISLVLILTSIFMVYIYDYDIIRWIIIGIVIGVILWKRKTVLLIIKKLRGKE